jgi:hypothetical protein
MAFGGNSEATPQGGKQTKTKTLSNLQNFSYEVSHRRGHATSYLMDSLDALRNIGAFAAHPIKSHSTGEIIDVELGEAEWNLDVLESVFDFYFTQPAILQKKRNSLDAKLKDAGKPEMKGAASTA